MTNDNKLSHEGQRGLFAAIMVVSMVAVGFAAAGLLLPATTDLTVDDVESGNDFSGTVENDTDSTGDIYIVLDEDVMAPTMTVLPTRTTAAASGSRRWSGLSTDGLDEGDYTVSLPP